MKTKSPSNFMLFLPLVGVVVAFGIVSHQMLRRATLSDELKQNARERAQWILRYKRTVSQSATR